MVEAYSDLQRVSSEITELDSMLHGNDEELRKLAKEEKQLLEQQVPECCPHAVNTSHSTYCVPCSMCMGFEPLGTHCSSHTKRCNYDRRKDTDHISSTIFHASG